MSQFGEHLSCGKNPDIKFYLWVWAGVTEEAGHDFSGGLTIKELNDLLDRLASSENRYAGGVSLQKHCVY